MSTLQVLEVTINYDTGRARSRIPGRGYASRNTCPEYSGCPPILTPSEKLAVVRESIAQLESMASSH